MRLTLEIMARARFYLPWAMSASLGHDRHDPCLREWISGLARACGITVPALQRGETGIYFDVEFENAVDEVAVQRIKSYAYRNTIKPTGAHSAKQTTEGESHG